jgi:ABC-type antimicrobial peptide transport system permease subunit
MLSIDSAMTLYRRPLQKERAIAWVLGILAASSLAIGLLGMLSLMAMLMRSLKVELAVRYAVGATRRQVAEQMAKRLLIPAAMGVAFAGPPAAAGVYLLGQALETTSRAGLWGPVIALIVVTSATAGVVLHSARSILGANFMDWLRYE